MMWLLLSLCMIPAVTGDSVQCLSSTGQPVDWFVVYKLPKLPANKTSSPILAKGLGYYYMDVDNQAWQLSKDAMDASNNAVRNTLQSIYQTKQGEDFMYFMYNDEDPDEKTPRNCGHSKGVVAFDKDTGFWLVHSTPKFPPFKRDGYHWSALREGQSFLCVSYSYSTLDSIAKQNMFNHVNVYDHYAPETFLSENPNLAAVLGHKHPMSPPWTSVVVLTSIHGYSFKSFAKTAEYNDDLYTALLAPTMKSDLLTETWQDGRGKMPSNCTSSYKVCNVQLVRLPEGVSVKETKDHSKWAVTTQANLQWVCIGDINRQVHQMKRGGGTVCFQNSKVWSQFKQSIAQYEKC